MGGGSLFQAATGCASVGVTPMAAERIFRLNLCNKLDRNNKMMFTPIPSFLVMRSAATIVVWPDYQIIR